MVVVSTKAKLVLANNERRGLRMQTGSTCQLTGDCRIPDRATLPGTLYKELEDFIATLPTKEGHLVTVLHKAQHLFGYLPKEVQQFVADYMGVSLAKVYGVVSFYTFFTMVPKGKYPISICMGTACFVKGAQKVVEAFLQTPQRRSRGSYPGREILHRRPALRRRLCTGSDSYGRGEGIRTRDT